MLKIWGRTNSVNVKKALWCLEELSLPYERIDAGMQYGVVDTPEYRKMNPNGLVPTLDEDGFILWESHSIVRYLAAKYGKGVLWPTDQHACAVANQWMDWTFSFQTALRDVFWGLVRTPPEKRDLKLIEEKRKKTGEMLGILDAALAGRHYVAGAFSMGDVPIGCHVQLWMRLPIERPAQPNLDAWFERLCARPAYKKIVDLPLS
ncbi:MAG: glutathione S-transferase [Betaproteobacteria bacterium RBG_16_66_20]|nr:MAG: glutathione S-transferase [Betaproteobacteria bacterium RBG_16_66_20]